MDPLARKSSHHRILQRYVVNQAAATRQSLGKLGDGRVMLRKRMSFGDQDLDGLCGFRGDHRRGLFHQLLGGDGDHGLPIHAALPHRRLEFLQTVPEMSHPQDSQRSVWSRQATTGRCGNTGELGSLGQPDLVIEQLNVALRFFQPVKDAHGDLSLGIGSSGVCRR